jgi:hypothetical protein
MSSIESCPECGCEEYDDTGQPGHPSASDRLPDLVIYVCRECGTAWDAEKPTR